MLKKRAVIMSLFALLSFCATSGQSESDVLYPIEWYGKGGYIDKTGRIIVNPQFDIAYFFSEGIGLFSTALSSEVDGQAVKIPQKSGYIDRSGNYVWRPTK